jgi:hypothetical protein
MAQKPQGPANSFVVACAFAPVAGALCYKAPARVRLKFHAASGFAHRRNRTVRSDPWLAPFAVPFESQGKPVKGAAPGNARETTS